MNQFKNPKITGSRMERHSKKMLTIVFACIFMAAFGVAHGAYCSPILFAAVLAAGVETVILAVFHERLPLLLGSLPFFHAAVCCIFRAVALLKGKESLSAVFLLLIAALLLLSGLNSIKASCGEDEKMQFEERLTRKLLLVLIVVIGLPAVVIHLSGGRVTLLAAMAEGAALVSFVLATYLASLPDCIVFNVKRIGRLCLMFAVVLILGLCMIKAASLIFNAPISLRTLLLIAMTASVDILMFGIAARYLVGIFRNNKGSGIFSWKYKPLTAEQQARRISEGLARDYIDEYASRYWNVSMYTAEIAGIQSQITKLRTDRTDLRNADALTHLDVVAKRLLSRLEEYQFHTGFDLYEADDTTENGGTE